MDICPSETHFAPSMPITKKKKKKSGAAIVSMTDLFLKYSDYNVLQHSSTGGIFCNTSTDGGWLPPLPWIFAMEPPILMILVLQDRYESPGSIDTKRVPVAFRLTSQWWFNDVIVTKTGFLQIFFENTLIFKFSPKNLGKCDFDGILC